MKKINFTFSNICIILLSLFLITAVSCKKEEDPNIIPDPLLDNNYRGSLYVKWTNTLPPWSATTSMDVFIDKQLGVITIDAGTLSYSGDTIIGDDSRLERSGQWSMNPTGILMGTVGNLTIDIDTDVVVQNDVQRIYAKVDGEWVLVNETPFNETPYSEFTFDFNEAILNGSTISVSVGTGSILWRLTLTPGP